MVDEKEAMIDFKDENGNSLLHLAVLFDSIQSVRALVKGGLLDEVKNNDGKTPLDIAVDSTKPNVVNVLMKYTDCLYVLGHSWNQVKFIIYLI